MKKIVLICSAFMLSNVILAQTDVSKTSTPATITPVVPQAPEMIQLSESEHDFGKIPQGKPVSHAFLVKNLTKDSLKLENVQASCGCTTPTWSKESVAPGQSTNITVGYNAAGAGPFEKYITIFYAGGKTKLYKIKGEVYATPAESAPTNKSTSTLKN